MVDENFEENCDIEIYENLKDEFVQEHQDCRCFILNKIGSTLSVASVVIAILKPRRYIVSSALCIFSIFVDFLYNYKHNKKYVFEEAEKETNLLKKIEIMRKSVYQSYFIIGFPLISSNRLKFIFY